MEDEYFVEMPDGARYGPADLATPKSWVAEGRIGATTILVSEASGERMRAHMVSGLIQEPLPGAVGAPPPMIPLGMNPGLPRKRSPVALILTIVLVLSCVPILVLSAILLPVFGQAKKAAKRTRTMSDIKYLTSCIILYTSDADERYPPNMTSASTLEPFLRPYASNSNDDLA
ncbi:MAG: hypothetical protein C4320_04540 [Armatimonadota bacterium]